jgi:hypothetical protein
LFRLSRKSFVKGEELIDRLVNMQAVIADTKRGIAEVQTKIDRLLRKDIDGRVLVSRPLTN